MSDPIGVLTRLPGAPELLTSDFLMMLRDGDREIIIDALAKAGWKFSHLVDGWAAPSLLARIND